MRPAVHTQALQEVDAGQTRWPAQGLAGGRGAGHNRGISDYRTCAAMEIASFDDLLRVARAQAEPHRLLFVFAGAMLPDNASAAPPARFEAGDGSGLAPLLSVDKAPAELEDFAALAEEAWQFEPTWAIVFAAALPGPGGRAPGQADVDVALQRMSEAVRRGAIATYVAFDREGLPVQLVGQ
jgi:hypothetical protein